MSQVRLDFAVVEKAAIDAFQESCFLLGRQFTQVISDPNAFPEFPGQDIVDRGELRASQQLRFIKPEVGQFDWSVDYGIHVLTGYTLRNGTTQPGRDWIKLGLEQFDLQATFGKLLGSKL